MNIKKCSFLFWAVLLVSMTEAVAAGNDCAKDEYPNLYTDAYAPTVKTPDGKTQVTILQTIPWSKVTYLKGLMYEVTHPEPGNECTTMKTVVTDTWSEGLREIYELCQKYPKAIDRCSITIELIVIDGIAGKWRVHSSEKPINPEKL